MKMLFSYLLMKNYRQYKEVKIMFTQPNKEKNFTIIQGSNGAGKTNILNAITWCLFGKELHMGTKYKGLPLINSSIIKELNENEVSEVSVEIEMFDDDGEKLIITRKKQYIKTSQGIKEYMNMENELEIMRQINNDMKKVYEPQYVINKLIPPNMEPYFFFDGEQLNLYFKETSGEKIKNTVFSISQIELLEKVIEHLTNRKNDFIKKSKDYSPRMEEINKTILEYTKQKDRYSDLLLEFRRQKKDAELKEEEFSEKMRNCDNINVVTYENEIKSLELDINNYESDLKQTKISLNNHISKYLPIILGYEAIKYSIDEISKREEAGEIPPEYKKDFILKILQKGKCICGSNLFNEELRSNVEEFLLRGSKLEDISIELTKLFATLNSLPNIKDFEKEHSRLNQTILSIQNRINEKGEKILINKEYIKGLDIEQIKFWLNKKEEYTKLKDQYISEIAKYEVRLEDANKKINNLELKLKEELKKEEKSKHIFKILNYIDNLLLIANDVKNKIMKQIKQEIEQKTREQFFSLIWKKETYKDVIIDDNYNISVIHESGMEGIGSLSAGERQILALSFMAALNNVSGFNVPIIIDTPLGRISKEPKLYIANNLPNYLKDKQVTMLVIDEEYTEDVRNRILKRVDYEYKIKFYDKEGYNYSEVLSYE